LESAKVSTRVVFKSALSGRLTIAQQFTAEINEREDVVGGEDD
jgi:hypothetical protein